MAPTLGQDKNTWVGTSASDVMLVQLTRNGNTLSGVVDDASLPTGQQDPTKVNRQHVGFTGTVDGTSITLKLELGLGTSAPMYGTLTPDKMTLNYPSDSGGIQAIDLAPSTVEAYNRASAGLQTKVDQVIAQQQQAQAQAAQQEADAQLGSDIDKAAQTVNDDYAALGSLGKTDFSAFDSYLGEARKNLKDAQSYAATARSTGHDVNGDGCVAAGDAQSAAGSVQSDMGSIESEVATVSDTTDGLKSAASQLGTDIQSFNDALAQLPDYSYSPSLPASALMSSLISGAGTQADQDNARAKGYLATVSALSDQAVKEGESADAAAC